VLEVAHSARKYLSKSTAEFCGTTPIQPGEGGHNTMVDGMSLSRPTQVSARIRWTKSFCSGYADSSRRPRWWSYHCSKTTDPKPRPYNGGRQTNMLDPMDAANLTIAAHVVAHWLAAAERLRVRFRLRD